MSMNKPEYRNGMKEPESKSRFPALFFMEDIVEYEKAAAQFLILADSGYFKK